MMKPFLKEAPWLVLGIGNLLRQDDGAGPRVLEHLDSKSIEADCQSSSGDGGTLLEILAGRSRAIIVDAVQAAGRPGAIYRFDGAADIMPTSFFHYSTHAFSLAEALALGRALNMLPDTLIVFGIEGVDFGYGPGLNPAVEKATQAVATEITMLLTKGETLPNPTEPPIYPSHTDLEWKIYER